MPFSSYMRSELGTAVIEPGPEVEAGSHVALTITYTAGKFGIDDTGALKFSWRTASDSGKPQFSDPKAPNYTTVEASNGAALHIEYNRNNIRPWVSTIFVRVMDGFLRAGEQIVLAHRRHATGLARLPHPDLLRRGLPVQDLRRCLLDL